MRMNCGRYQSRTCWKEEGALSYSAAAALSQQTKAAVAAVTRTTQWGTTRLFHHNERRLIFGGPMGHRSLMRRRQRCKNPTMHSLVGGREIAISTGLSCSGQMGALGLKRGLKQRWKRGLHAYPNREEIYSLLKRISGTAKMCCCRDGSRKLHASWIDARRSRGGFQLRTISLQRRAKSLSTHQGASCTHYRAF